MPVGHHQIPDALDELMGGRRAQQGIQVSRTALMPDQRMKGRHQHAAPAIDLRPVKRPTSVAISTAAVATLSLRESMAVASMAGRPASSPAAGYRRNIYSFTRMDAQRIAKISGLEVHRFRMQDLLNGRLPQLQAHQQDQDRYRQAGDVLHPPVAEGVFGVRLLPAS